MNHASPYPLAWPVARPRTLPGRRRHGKFRTAAGDLSVAAAVKRAVAEIERLGGRYAVVSSNIPTRLDGMPRSGAPEPSDPGVAVYFVLDGKPVCMPCDTYDRVAANIAAVAAHIEATRAIERHGVGTAAEALMAFMALPAPGAVRTWREVFGFAPGYLPERSVVEAAYRRMAKDRHPDAGGSADAMAELNAARDAALKEIAP